MLFFLGFACKTFHFQASEVCEWVCAYGAAVRGGRDETDDIELCRSACVTWLGCVLGGRGLSRLSRMLPRECWFARSFMPISCYGVVHSLSVRFLWSKVEQSFLARSQRTVAELRGLCAERSKLVSVSWYGSVWLTVERTAEQPQHHYHQTAVVFTWLWCFD